MRTITFQYRYRLILLIFLACLFQRCKTDSKQVAFQIPDIEQDFISEILLIDSISKITRDFESANNKILKLGDSLPFSSYSAYTKSLFYHKLGVGAYRAYAYEAAIEYMNKAVELREPQHAEKNNEIHKSYYVRSLSYYKLNQIKEAIADINECIKIEEKYSKLTKHQLGVYYSKMGEYTLLDKEYSKVLDYLDQANTLLDSDSKQKAENYNSYGNYYSAVNKNDLAIENFEKALYIFSKMPAELEWVYSTKLNLIHLKSKTNDYQTTRDAYTELLSQIDATDARFDVFRSSCFNNMGVLDVSNNNGKAGLENYTKLLALAKKTSASEKTVAIARAYEGIGDAENVLNNYDSAINSYHNAIKALAIGFDESNQDNLPDLKEHVVISQSELERILGFKADAINSKYTKSKKLTDLLKLLKAYKLQDVLLTKIRQGYKSSASRYQLVTSMIPFYQKATEASLLLFEKTKDQKYLYEAYNFASKNKAIVLLDGLQNEEAKFADIPEKLLLKESNLKKEIYQLENEIFEIKKTNLNDSDKVLGEKLNERFSKTRAYENLVDELEKEYPNYYQLKYAAKSNMDVDQLIQSLPDSTALVEYFVTSNKLFTFLITKKSGLQSFVQKRPSKFGTRCKAFRAYSEKDSLYSLPAFGELSFGLYQSLLQNPIDAIEKETDVNRLIIIPDDYLMQISFDVLTYEPLDPSIKKWSDEIPYLIKKYAISYAYNNQLLFDNNFENKVKQSIKGGYVGFGLEYDDYTLNALSAEQDEIEESLRRGMGKLFYSDDEVRESAVIFDGQAFINEKAIKENFKKAAPSANILHLVTHGFVVEDKPLASGLVLSKTRDSDDFILTASEFYSMKLDAKMAVLSACHTGDGKIQKGEGIRSLARAFSYAGCPNVTASLWGAPDLSTKEIVLPYFKNIKKGLPKDMALRNAKLTYLDNCEFDKESLPCNWGHLVTIGDVSPIRINAN